MAVMESYT